MIIASCLSRGLTLGDFEYLTIGDLFDILMEFTPEEERVYEATQDDINALKRGH